MYMKPSPHQQSIFGHQEFNSVLTLHFLPRRSIRFHSKELSTPNTTRYLRCQLKAQVVNLCVCAMGYKTETPKSPSLGLINLLEWLIILRKSFYSLDYQFITKDIKGYKSIAR